MIFDKLARLNRYRGLSPALDTAIAFLDTTDLPALPDGRVEIDGDTVYANHFHFATAPFAEGALYEDHIRYLDIHVDIAGREAIAVAPAQDLTFAKALPESEDAVLYTGPLGDTLRMDESNFLIVYPGEAHLPKLTNGEASQVNKLVVKVKIG